MRAIICCLFAVAALPVAAFSPCDGGVVFVDANGSGTKDSGERGVGGVRVSDGERIVETDGSGRYEFATGTGRASFLIKPAGFRAAVRSDGLPDTWSEVACHDYPLIRDSGKPAAPLEVLVFGDPQVKSLVDVSHYRQDIVEPVRGKHQARLGISLGDIVNDDLSLYPALKAVDASLGIPWLHAPGNHDLNFDADSDENSLNSFRRAFGPDTYAWEEHQANFIVLDDVVYQPGKNPEYIGGLREQQFKFLEAYLATASKQRLLVLSFHIPLFDTTPGVETFRRADRERLFTLLRDFPKVLVLSAHSHKQQHFHHGADNGWHGARPLHEYNVGAACGAFWTGVKDDKGIPDASMSDGTPNGYALVTIDGDATKLRWFVARATDDYQMRLHAPKVLRRGAFPVFSVYANVFIGDADTVVEYRIDDGDWKPMRRVLQADPWLLAVNVRDDEANALRGFDRAPEAAPSTHLWKGTLPTDLGAGSHRVQVRANIAGFGEASASTNYRLDDSAP